jgi:hypothetical protein
MKKWLLFASAIIFLFSLTANAQVKRVLLEQYTGAWCGWCVDGTVIMDEIITAHPDRVIGIKLHSGDNMEMPLTKPITSGLGVRAYPSGSIDRKRFGNAVPQSRGQWKGYCESQLAQPAKVEVNVTYNINKKNRQLMVKVYANMITTLFDPLRFNVIIIEDSVSGKGKGWDQSNYLSNRDGYENNPYYNQPRKIVGYQHMKVVRAYLGGAWGIQGTFEKPAQQGKVYVQDFNFTIPDNWKLEHLHIIGLVQIEAPAVKEILNCAYGVEGKASIELTSTGDSKGLGDVGLPFVKKFTLKNVAAEKKTFRIYTSRSERTPVDWLITIPELQSKNVTLAPDATFDFSLTMEPSATIGIGDANVIVEDTKDPKAFKGQGRITVYSARMSNIEIIPGGELAYALTPLLNYMGFDNFFQLTPDDYAEISTKLNRKNLIWNLGSATSLTAAGVQSVKEAIDSKIPVFICGNHSVFSLNNGAILTPYFGCSYNGYSTQGFGSAPWQVWFSAVDNDPITGSFGNSIEGNLIKYLVTLVKITDSQKTTPIMHFKNDGQHVVVQNNKRDTFNIKGEDAVFGVKVDNGQSRYVLLSITPYVLTDQNIRRRLIARIIRWINYDVMDVEDNTEISDFSVAPIPAQDNVTFNFSTSANTTIRIYNSMGMLVDEIHDLNTGNMYFYNTSSLSSGVYTAILNNGKVRQTTKFTIVK